MKGWGDDLVMQLRIQGKMVTFALSTLENGLSLSLRLIMRGRILIILFLFYSAAKGQRLIGLEEYYFSGVGGSTALVTQAYYQSAGGWYCEARYNYEADRAFSIYAGKTFTREDSLSYSITPLAGLVAGNYRGGSAGTDISMEFRSFKFNSELQYTL